jgi:serine/threonine protein kinase
MIAEDLEFGEVVVIDWGLAEHLDVAEAAPGDPSASAGGDTTAMGAVVGTPSYMPPEQAFGRGVDERADVYAIGGILYELLTGVPPIVGDSAKAVLEKLRSTRPIPVAERVREVPADLAAIVDKAMRYEAGERYREGGRVGDGPAPVSTR